MDEHYIRLLGVRDGLSHALSSVNSVKRSLTGPNEIYLPPKRHCRKRKAILDRISYLDRAHDIISRQLNDVKDAIASEQEQHND